MASDAELETERQGMLDRLRGMRVEEPHLQQRALATLARRLHDWRGEKLPVASGIARDASAAESVSAPDVRVELLILQAMAIRQPPTFGVTSDGAVFITDAPRNSDKGRFVFISGLSPVLDRVAEVYRHLIGGQTGRFTEVDGAFCANMPDAETRPFAVIGEPRKTIVRRVQNLVNVARRRFGPRERPQLVVSFRGHPIPDEGVLSEMGYHVGKSGPPTDYRREVLRRVFEAELISSSPQVDAYVREWGPPATSTRSRKMTACLVKFIELAQRKSIPDMSQAISDWESDLDWLRGNLRA